MRRSAKYRRYTDQEAAERIVPSIIVPKFNARHRSLIRAFGAFFFELQQIAAPGMRILRRYSGRLIPFLTPVYSVPASHPLAVGYRDDVFVHIIIT
jgi:hypothetical protein